VVHAKNDHLLVMGLLLLLDASLHNRAVRLPSLDVDVDDVDVTKGRADVKCRRTTTMMQT